MLIWIAGWNGRALRDSIENWGALIFSPEPRHPPAHRDRADERGTTYHGSWRFIGVDERAACQTRARTPALQPVRRPALHSGHSIVMRSRYYIPKIILQDAPGAPGVSKSDRSILPAYAYNERNHPTLRSEEHTSELQSLRHLV